MSKKMTAAERNHLNAVKAQLTPGTKFSTDFETGCIVSFDPEWDECNPYAFTAFDSDGVLCGFIVQMVRDIEPKAIGAGHLEPLPYFDEEYGKVDFCDAPRCELEEHWQIHRCQAHEDQADRFGDL